jgi:hypothetical protein
LDTPPSVKEIKVPAQIPRSATVNGKYVAALEGRKFLFVSKMFLEGYTVFLIAAEVG